MVFIVGPQDLKPPVLHSSVTDVAQLRVCKRNRRVSPCRSHDEAEIMKSGNTSLYIRDHRVSFTVLLFPFWPNKTQR